MDTEWSTLNYEDVFEGIRKYGKSVCPLRTLVDVLKKRPNNILELKLQHNFPTNNPDFPKVLFTPKQIIEYMRNTYIDIIPEPSNFVKFIYKYNSDDEEKEYVFSKNMTIYDDVIIICYLYCIMTSKSEYKESQPVIHLREIMRKKYIICDDLVDSTEKVTWFKIAHSFPSITFAIFIMILSMFLYLFVIHSLIFLKSSMYHSWLQFSLDLSNMLHLDCLWLLLS